MTRVDFLDDFDAFILSKFQSISDWSQKTFAKDNFFLARICLAILVVSLVTAILGYTFTTGDTSYLLTYFVLVAILAYLHNRIISAVEKRCQKNPEFKNIRAVADADFRLLSFIVLPMFAGIEMPRKCLHFIFKEDWHNKANISHFMMYQASIMSVFILIAMLYFIACTPNRMKRNKIKEFVSKMSKVFQHAGPVPQMSPS